MIKTRKSRRWGTANSMKLFEWHHVLTHCTEYTKQSKLHLEQVTMCTLHTAHCILHTAQCTLKTEHCTLHTAPWTLHTAHCTLHTAHCIQQTVHCRLLITHVTQHTWHSTQHTTHYTLQTVHCTPVTAPRTLHTRVSQEIFQTMATPKFSAFGYLNMEFIEQNKIYQIWGNFLWLFQNWKPH